MSESNTFLITLKGRCCCTMMMLLWLVTVGMLLCSGSLMNWVLVTRWRANCCAYRCRLPVVITIRLRRVYLLLLLLLMVPRLSLSLRLNLRLGLGRGHSCLLQLRLRWLLLGLLLLRLLLLGHDWCSNYGIGLFTLVGHGSLGRCGRLLSFIG